MTLGICVLGGRGRGVGRWADTVRGKAWTTSTHGFQRQNSRAARSKFGHGDRRDLSGFLLVLLLVLVVICKIRPRSAKYICIPIYRCVVVLDIIYISIIYV